MCATRSRSAAEPGTARARALMRRLIVNARIATGDPRRPWADALLLDGDRVVEIGTSAALRKAAPDAIVIDAAGAAVARDGAPYLKAASS